MEKKNSFLLTIIAVATLSVAVIGATFAYFASTINEGTGATFTANTAPMNSAFTAVGTNCSLTVTADKMQQADAGAANVAATSSSCSVTVSYASSVANTAMYCTYDVYWDWTGTAYTAHSPVSAGSSTKYTGNEFTVQGTATSAPAVAAGQNVLTNNISSEKDWTTVTTSTDPIKVGSGTIWSNSTSATTHTWTYTMKFYNAPAYQNDLAGKTFTGKFYVQNVVC